MPYQNSRNISLLLLSPVLEKVCEVKQGIWMDSTEGNLASASIPASKKTFPRLNNLFLKAAFSEIFFVVVVVLTSAFKANRFNSCRSSIDKPSSLRSLLEKNLPLLVFLQSSHTQSHHTATTGNLTLGNLSGKNYSTKKV